MKHNPKITHKTQTTTPVVSCITVQFPAAYYMRKPIGLPDRIRSALVVYGD